MAKLQILQAVLVTWCMLLLNTSEAIKKEQEQKLVNFIKSRVIPKFHGWTHKYSANANQFAVMMMMDSDSDWDSFEFKPDIVQEMNKLKIQPDDKSKMKNYFAAMPFKKGKPPIMHSEHRILNTFNDLLNAYKIHSNKNPEAVVLYTYNLPCYERVTKKTHACTDLLKEFHDKQKDAALDGVDFIVAYTKDNGNFRGCKCNKQQTVKKFEDAKLDLVQVPYNDLKSLIQRMYEFMTMIE